MSDIRRMLIPYSSACATARIVNGRLEPRFLCLSEFPSQQCRFKDNSRRSTTRAIAANPFSETFVRSVGLQSSRKRPSCRESPLSRPVLSTTRAGSILKCICIVTALSAGRPYPKAVRSSQRRRLEGGTCRAPLIGILQINRLRHPQRSRAPRRIARTGWSAAGRA
jgi:hypothetical protein